MCARLEQAQERALGCAPHGEARTHPPLVHWPTGQLRLLYAMQLQVTSGLSRPKVRLLEAAGVGAARAGLKVGTVEVLAVSRLSCGAAVGALCYCWPQ